MTREISLQSKGLCVDVRLQNIDLEIRAGTMTAVVGPNGAGKSTLLQALAGLISAGGEIAWNGEKVSRIPMLERGRRLAWVSQEAHVEFAFPVRDVIAQGRFAHGDDDQGVDESMRAFDLQHLANRPVTRLSGGERQRVMLARALATAAPLQLWDEPLAQLDIRHQLEVLMLARKWADTGSTLLLSLHDLRVAHCMDAVIVLDQGRLRGFGAPDEVLTAELIREVFGVDAKTSQSLILELPR
jgi:iron complex transport system ATP-binding protein